MDWDSIPLEGILLYIYDFFAYFELVMVLWNANHPLIVIRHNKVLKWGSNAPFKACKSPIFYP